ncbi:MAG: AAA family ATPase, partial [bacterium]
AGKSNVLDALRFLCDGMREKDFSRPLEQRGRALHLAWKGAPADEVELVVEVVLDESRFKWTVVLDEDGLKQERVDTVAPGKWPEQILDLEYGKGKVKSGQEWRSLDLRSSTGCALATAVTDPAFAARELQAFIDTWAFFDLEPQQLRRASYAGFGDGDLLEMHGRNLAQRLYALEHGSEPARASFDRIVQSTRDVLGLPDTVETRQTDEGRFYFVQREHGLAYPVNQIATSSGTLRVLGLMAALFDESHPGLVGVEEPENYVHPRALADLAAALKAASASLQVVATTHSPALLNAIGDASAVRVITRDQGDGTTVANAPTVSDIQQRLAESGFALGDFLDATGFGA